MKKLVAVNAKGIRIGEDHQNAKWTNDEIEMIRELHREGLTYETLATKFGGSKWAIARICRYERRGEIPHAWKAVHVPDRGEG